jgi:hypothetical protein
MGNANLKMLVVGVLLVGGCTGLPNNPIGGITNTEGFEPFDTPRDFHGPGTVLRRSPDGAVYLVGTINSPSSGGMESFPDERKTREMSLSALIETIGVPAETVPAQLKAQASRKAEIKIKAFEGQRSATDDSYLSQLTAFFSTRRVFLDNQYYVIRETIASQKINFSSTSDWTVDLQASAEVKEWARGNGTVKFGSGQSLEFVKEFSKPMNILYKPEKLTLKPASGAGPNQFEVTAQRAAPGTISIPKEVRHD